MENKQVVLARRPNGAPVEADFAVRTVTARSPRQGEALIQNLFVSLDAGFRNWMDEGAGDEVLPAMAIGEPVMGLTIGRVKSSNHDRLSEGQLVMGRLAWESWSIATAADFLIPLPDRYDCPPSYHLGILGDTGMSAYFGLKDIGKPRPTDTVLISAAGGAVGSIAGQVARIMGARRVVGFAGSEDKCQRLTNELGYDAAINYKNGNLIETIAAACPDGVDIYFDNVGGPLLSAVLENINSGARIPFCGAVSNYTNKHQSGPDNLFQLVTNCVRLEGFLTHHQVDRYDEARDQLMQWLQSGQLKCFEHRYVGVENCGRAFSDLFAGRNFGKTVVQVEHQ